ncbi:MAG: DUF4328 domain-containing protein [Bacteroidota bacterium]|nr:DUF4328 domain-containing protein [Bacteroidota bacterium]
MELLRPNQQRAKLAILLVWAVFGIKMIALISDVMQYSLLKSMANGELVTEPEKIANDMREAIISLFYLVIFIGSIITFIQWFRRAYFNLGLLSNNLSTTDGWASGAWFIPIMSLYRPYQMMKEMFIVTNLILKTKVEGYRSMPSVKTVGVWWTFWIISNILGNIVVRIQLNATAVDGMMTATLCQIILGFFYLPLTLITVRLIKEYAFMEIQLVNLQPVYSDSPFSTINKE